MPDIDASPARFGLGRRLACALLPLVLMFNPAQAVDVRLSGFLSLVGGQVIDGSRQTPYNGFACPCFVADWTHLALYDDSFSLDRESRVGVRLDADLADRLIGSVQAVARGTAGSEGVSLDVATLAYEFAPDWRVQIGRKKLPIYYYSDFQDVGYAYPWVRPPQDLYGWEISSFNGATLVHQARWGEWAARASLFFGRENDDDNALAANYYPGRVEVTWSNILGTDLELTRDWLNLRLVYIQSDVDTASSVDGVIFDGERQRIYGLSANIDYDNWLLRSELSLFDRWDFDYKSKAAMLAVGYRFGDLTPLLTYSRYWDRNQFDAGYQQDQILSLTLHYDLGPQSVVKLQYDRFLDESTEDFVGDSGLISISYDRVF